MDFTPEQIKALLEENKKLKNENEKLKIMKEKEDDSSDDSSDDSDSSSSLSDDNESNDEDTETEHETESSLSDDDYDVLSSKEDENKNEDEKYTSLSDSELSDDDDVVESKTGEQHPRAVNSMRSNNLNISLNERKVIQYTREEIESIKKERDKLLERMNKDKFKIYPNQEKQAKEIVERLNNRLLINLMVLGMTQSGKTGTMLATIKEYISNYIIPNKNIYIITGLSSRNWRDQTQKRLPKVFKNRVYHRNDLIGTKKGKLQYDINGKKNILIIIDENQIAARKDQTINLSFEKMGFYDKNFLLENDIKIIQFSATPDQCFEDIKDWEKHSEAFRLDSGNGYTSCFKLNNSGRVKQFQDLSEQEQERNGKKKSKPKVTRNAETAIIDLRDTIEENYPKPMNHIIRVFNEPKQRRIKKNLKDILKKKLSLHMKLFIVIRNQILERLINY